MLRCADDNGHEKWLSLLEGDLRRAQELIDWLLMRKSELVALEARHRRMQEAKERRQREEENERRRIEETTRAYANWRAREETRLSAEAKEERRRQEDLRERARLLHPVPASNAYQPHTQPTVPATRPPARTQSTVPANHPPARTQPTPSHQRPISYGAATPARSAPSSHSAYTGSSPAPEYWQYQGSTYAQRTRYVSAPQATGAVEQDTSEESSWSAWGIILVSALCAL